MMIRILLATLLVMPAAAGAQTPDDIFANETLQEIRLFMHSQDLRELRERYAEDVYFPADFQWRGTHVSNVGVRVRGVATRSAVKPGCASTSIATSRDRRSSASAFSCWTTC